MNIESLLSHYGYLALLIGTFLEGETILILGGLAAQRGYLDLPLVILAAFAGTFFGDQFFFFLGRWRGRLFLSRRPTWAKRVEKANQLLDRYQWLVILGFRFLYGLRTVIPFSIGLSRIQIPRFLILNFAGGVIWAVAIGMGGYLFGHALEALLGEIKHYELAIMLVIAFLGCLLWFIRFWRRKRQVAKARYVSR